MKKYILLTILSITSSCAVEQTICFSQEEIGKYPSNGNPMYMATLGDSATLNGGKCNGRKLADMNKDGWRLIQVVGGLNSSFGMVFEKGK